MPDKILFFVRHLTAQKTQQAQTHVTTLKYFMVFAQSGFSKSFFPSWLNVQPEKLSKSLTKVIKRSGATVVLKGTKAGIINKMGLPT